MTVNLSLLGGAGWQFSDNNGSPLSGGLLYTYQAGTTTPQATYTSNTGVTAQTNPIVLDSAGRIAGGEIWLTQGQDYKFILKTSAGATIGTYDNVPGANDISQFIAPTGSSLIGYLPAGSGAVATTVQTKLRESVSVKDFGAVGNGVADDTAAIQAAITASSGIVFFPVGTYLFSSTLTIDHQVSLKGAGNGVVNNDASGTILKKAASLNGAGINVTGSSVVLQDFTLQGVTGNGGDGIVFAGLRPTAERVSIFNMGNDGFRIGTDTGANANVWSLINIRSKNNIRRGLYIHDAIPDANAGVLNLCDIQLNGAEGVYLGKCSTNTFIGMCVQENWTYGVYCSSLSSGNYFYGGDYEVNGRQGTGITSYYDFYIQAGSTYNQLLGGLSYNFPQSFQCNDTNNTIISFRDNSYTGQDQYAGIQIPNIPSPIVTVLDYYKEGTFTPALTFVTPGNLSISYAANGQVGTYTRIGNKVFFSIYLQTSSFTWTTAAGILKITGLPYVASPTTNNFGGGSVAYQGVTLATNQSIVARVDPFYDYIIFEASGSGVSLVILSTTDVPSGGTPTFFINGSYSTEAV